ncbi:MAG TPA: DUF1780 domain-containing protein, partial [Anaerolineales bacterium]
MSQLQSENKSEKELLDALRKSALEELRFFSNGGKQERERWVVSQFLSQLNLTFDETELCSLDLHNKIDVQFRDANFQVKEILTKGVMRYRDAEAKYKALVTAKNLRDIKWPSFGYDIPPISTIYNLVSAETLSLSYKAKYASIKSGLDLLFYVTRIYASLIKKGEIDSEYLSSIGWRSISCLAGDQAIVLFAS